MLPPCAAILHRRHHVLEAQPHAAHVYRHDAIEVLDGAVDDRIGAALDAGVGQQGIDRPAPPPHAGLDGPPVLTRSAPLQCRTVALQRRRYVGLGLRRLGYVGREVTDLAHDGGRGRLQGACVPVYHQHLGAGRREELRRCHADAAGRAGDYRYLVLESIHRVSTLPFGGAIGKLAGLQISRRGLSVTPKTMKIGAPGSSAGHDSRIRSRQERMPSPPGATVPRRQKAVSYGPAAPSASRANGSGSATGPAPAPSSATCRVTARAFTCPAGSRKRYATW